MEKYHYNIPNNRPWKDRAKEAIKNKQLPLWSNLTIISGPLGFLPKMGLLLVYFVFLAAALGSGLILSTTTGFFARDNFTLNIIIYVFIIYIAYSIFEVSEICASLVCIAPAWYIVSDVFATMIFHVKVKKFGFVQYIALYLFILAIMMLIMKLLVYYRKRWRIKDLDFDHPNQTTFFQMLYQQAMSAFIMAFGTYSGYIFSHGSKKKTYYTIKEFWDIIVADYLVGFIVLSVILFLILVVLSILIHIPYAKRELGSSLISRRAYEEEHVISWLIEHHEEDWYDSINRRLIERGLYEKINAIRKAYEKYDSEKQPLDLDYRISFNLPDMYALHLSEYENLDNYDNYYELSDEELYNLYGFRV